MSIVWAPALIDRHIAVDQVLVHGPDGFLTGPNGLLFDYEWTHIHGLKVLAEHGIGFYDGQTVHLLEVSNSSAVPGCSWRELRPLMFERDIETFRMLGYAAQIGTWARQHLFCGACGSPTQSLATERAKYCEACEIRSYPRVSPCMIVLVTRGEEILLARSPSFPLGLYSTLAGFAEPGESMEECVIREIREEVGLEVNDIRYIASQSWPYPHSMMFGFHAQYLSGEISPQPGEIEDARWFNLNSLPELSSRRSISRYLIEHYIAYKNSTAKPELPR